MSHSDGPTYFLNEVKAAEVSDEKEFTSQGRKETEGRSRGENKGGRGRLCDRLIS